MNNFSIQLVKKIAKLARIKISDEEASQFSIDLTNILNEMHKLQEVDTSDVEPLVNITEKEIILREDQITDGNILQKVLSNAKNAQFNCYTVPKVIE